MDKNDTIYREHSAKEHLILAVMILLAFFFLTSQYNSHLFPFLTTGTITGAATIIISEGSLVVWSVIMLLLIMGIIVGLIIWWKNHKKIQVQKALQHDINIIVNAAGKLSKSAPANRLARKLIKVQQELVNIHLRSATKGHIIRSIPSKYQKIPRSPSYLRHVLPRKKAHHKIVHHKLKYQSSLNEKMLNIQKEIDNIKTRE